MTAPINKGDQTTPPKARPDDSQQTPRALEDRSDPLWSIQPHLGDLSVQSLSPETLRNHLRAQRDQATAVDQPESPE